MYRAFVAGVLPLVLVAAPVAGPARAGTVLVSVSRHGGPANRLSVEPSVSGDGRYVAFASQATNLVAGDRNNRMDVFVRDLATGTTRLVSLGAGGVPGNGRSTQPAISANGRYVAFTSEATNLVPGDTNGQPDVFVRDLRAGTTRRVSVATGGAQAGGDSAFPAISADGRYVAFLSGAANLVPGDTNHTSDAFVRDLRARTTERVSVGAGGAQADAYADAPDISADGRYVSFVSPATDLVAGDTSGLPDVFVRDRVAGTTARVSVGPGGAQADGANTQAALSADGRHVAFVSEADNLVPTDTDTGADVLLRDLTTGTTRQVSVRADHLPGSYAAEPDVSAHGGLVTFVTPSPLLPGVPDGTVEVYVRDMRTGAVRLVSASSGGVPGDQPSADPSISPYAGRIAFATSATNLVPGDTNRADDVYSGQSPR